MSLAQDKLAANPWHGWVFSTGQTLFLAGSLNMANPAWGRQKAEGFKHGQFVLSGQGIPNVTVLFTGVEVAREDYSRAIRQY